MAICSDCDVRAGLAYRKVQDNRSSGQYKVKVWECPECDNVGVKVQDTYPQGNKTVALEGRISIELVDFDKVDEYRENSFRIGELIDCDR